MPPNSIMVKKSLMDIPNKPSTPAPSGMVYDKYARQKVPREDIEQFVRLLKDFPLPGKSGDFPFTKNKNPLPEIGQGRCPVKVPHCADISEDIEPVTRTRTHSVGEKGDNNNYVAVEKSVDSALFQRVLHQRHATSDLIRLDRTSSSLENPRLLMSSSLSAHPAIPIDFDAAHCKKQKLARTRSDPTRRRATADVRNLPPLPVSKQAFIECPSRPSAPSPSCTPPLPSSDDDVFPEEEPDDFIDIH